MPLAICVSPLRSRGQRSSLGARQANIWLAEQARLSQLALTIHPGLEHMLHGVVLSGPSFRLKLPSATDCYHACYRARACTQFTFKDKLANGTGMASQPLCLLKGTTATAVRVGQGPGRRVAISGKVNRSEANAWLDSHPDATQSEATRSDAGSTQPPKLRVGAGNMLRGVSFSGDPLTGASRRAAVGNATECYAACEAVRECHQFTFKSPLVNATAGSPAARLLCLLKGSSATLSRTWQGPGRRVVTSGRINRTLADMRLASVAQDGRHSDAGNMDAPPVLRIGQGSMLRGVAFIGDPLTGASRRAAVGNATECYAACEAVRECYQFTFKWPLVNATAGSPAARPLCLLKGPHAGLSRVWQGPSRRAVISGMVNRTAADNLSIGAVNRKETIPPTSHVVTAATIGTLSMPMEGWRRRRNRNCFTSHGATHIGQSRVQFKVDGTLPLGAVRECIERCNKMRHSHTCTGVTLLSRPTRWRERSIKPNCFYRSNLTIAQCMHDARFDTYHVRSGK